MAPWVKQEIGINYYKPRKDVGAIYVSPVFEITDMFNFADDNFILQVNNDCFVVCFIIFYLIMCCLFL